METAHHNRPGASPGQMLANEGNPPQINADDEKLLLIRIIQNASIPLYVINSTHAIQIWNNAMGKLTGKSSFQMKTTKQHWSPFYKERQPMLADMVLNQNFAITGQLPDYVENVRFEEGMYRTEGWFDNVGGKQRYLLFEAAPIKNGRNELVAAIETVRDLTEIKLAHESMDSHNRFLQEILEAIPNPVFYKDADHAYLGCNKAFSAFFGRSIDEVLGKKIVDIIPEYLKEENVRGDQEVIATRTSVNYDTSLLRHDGQIRTVLVTKAPFSNADGSLGGIVGTFVDITEQRLMDEQIKIAKREWEETLDSLRDFVILTDSEHRVRRCNRLMCDMTGKSFDEVLGQDWRELLPDAGFLCTHFDGTTGELVHDDSKHIYSINIYTMTEPNGEKISGFVISINDVTEIRVITEELQRTSSELSEAQHTVIQQEKMASIGQLAAGVAHEINNPMGFISSNLSTLDKYLERFREYIKELEQEVLSPGSGGGAERIREQRKNLKIDYILDDTKQLIAESQDGAGRVRRIVQDLKNFSRVDQAEFTLVDLNACLDTTINIAWNEIKYVAKLNRDFVQIPQLKCHPQQLNQVFLNLLVNAAQAMKEQGEITVSTRSDEESVLVSVCDTGCGMPPEVVNRIFEPFFTTKDVGKGTGLGLSISYDIVKKHGGSIGVESVVGSGTTFTVRLPLDLPAVETGNAV